MKIETKRLILRELAMSDLADLNTILSDPDSMKHYPQPFTYERSKKWIEWNLDNYRQYGFGLWAVILKNSQLFIGDCGITMQNIDGKMVPEIGYHINKHYNNKGYATEAAQACRDYAFEILKLPVIYSYMKYTNIASQRVAEKNNMRLIKSIEDDKNELTNVYAITLSEYLQLRK